MNLGLFIKRKRLEKGLTMEQLGNAIQKNKAFISRLENNKVKSLKSDLVEPLAKALDIPVMALFENFDEKGNSKLKTENITPKQLVFEVKCLLDKTIDLTEQEKQYVINTLDIVCSEEK
jgi:transcriptional regulator with XRE-family HTH domain